MNGMGLRELRYTHELTLAYSNGLKDVIDVINTTVIEHPELTFRYAKLLDLMNSLVAPGEGGLLAVMQECRVLLGEEGRPDVP
jgi:hypothetical protein